MRAAKVYVNKILAGILTESDDHSYTFRYDDGYMADNGQSSISLTLPKSEQEHRSATLFPFFSNMLSEGVNKQIQASKFKIDEEDAFGFLLATASEDTIGSVTIEEIKQ